MKVSIWKFFILFVVYCFLYLGIVNYTGNLLSSFFVFLIAFPLYIISIIMTLVTTVIFHLKKRGAFIINYSFLFVILFFQIISILFNVVNCNRLLQKCVVIPLIFKIIGYTNQYIDVSLLNNLSDSLILLSWLVTFFLLIKTFVNSSRKYL